MRAFRFGVQGAAALTEPSWSEFVRRAEDFGYDVVSLADHFDGRPAPTVALAYAAAVTDRIRLGTAVLGVDFRNPVLLAQEVATLDELSRGRVELGLGAGWKREDYDVTGIPFDPPGVRIERLAAAVPELRAALRPDLPVMLGGGGPRMLTLAARLADIVSIVPPNPGGRSDPWGPDGTRAAFAEKAAFVRDAAGARGGPDRAPHPGLRRRRGPGGRRAGVRRSRGIADGARAAGVRDGRQAAEAARRARPVLLHGRARRSSTSSRR